MRESLDIDQEKRKLRRVCVAENGHSTGATRMKNRRELPVWQKSVEIGAAVYAATARMPSEERGLLGVELRRLALTISSGVAASSAAHSRELRLKFLFAAQAAVFELESLLAIGAQRIGTTIVPIANNLAELEMQLASELQHTSRAPREAHAKACALPEQHALPTTVHPPHPHRTHT
jgi:four helix bundle protein